MPPFATPLVFGCFVEKSEYYLRTKHPKTNGVANKATQFEIMMPALGLSPTP